jgi:hypothetical protein
MYNAILSILFASTLPLVAMEPESVSQPQASHQQESGLKESGLNQVQDIADHSVEYTTPGDLLSALAQQDKATTSLTGNIRYTIINALENDRQTRLGKLAILNAPTADKEDNQDEVEVNTRKYAVSFNILEIDSRREQIQEHFIFDGRWFVERLPEEKQFNKRELVAPGQTLDPMELMRDAPFWVSLGHAQDRLLASYDVELLDTPLGLIDNADFPELRFLADLPHVINTYQLKLTPKPGSGFEDDWEWVRIWIDKETLLPALYIKSEWTGDLQIVDLFSATMNAEIPIAIFDTTTPDARSGWRVQISNWRGDS